MKNILLVCAFLCWSWRADGQEPTYTVKEVRTDRNRAVVETNQTAAVGDELIATNAAGKQCALSVTQVKDKLLSVDTSKCQFAADLAVGQKLAKSLLFEEPKAEAPPADVKIAEAAPSPAPTPAPTPAAVADELKTEPVPTDQRVRSITDLQYRPEAGRVAVRVGYSSSTGTETTKIASTNATAITTDSKIQLLDGAVAFGVSDTVAIAASFATGSVSSDDKYGPGSTINGQKMSYERKGTTDPAFLVNVRVTDQEESSANIDLGLTYSPKTVDAVRAAVGKEGNLGRGGDVFAVSASVGKDRGPFEFSLSGSYSVYSKRTSKAADTNAEQEKTGGNAFSLKGSAQVNFKTGAALVGHITGVANEKTTYTTGTTSSEVSAYGETRLGVDLKYPVIGERVMATVGLQYSTVSEAAAKIGTVDVKSSSNNVDGIVALTAQF